jgi:hypothetical protein
MEANLQLADLNHLWGWTHGATVIGFTDNYKLPGGNGDCQENRRPYISGVMRRVGGYFLLGLVLLAGAETLSGDSPPPASREKSGLNPYLYQENMIIDGPSDYWLVAVPRLRPVIRALWCDTADKWDEILRVDGQSVHSLTREEVADYFSGAHGWPVHLIVRPQSGGTRALDCFEQP